jgi:hypothetical protein
MWGFFCKKKRTRISLGTILIAGAINDLAGEIIDRLTTRGYHCRVIGDASTAIAPAPQLELVSLDLTNPLSLTAAVFTDVTAIIYLDRGDDLALTNLLAAARDDLPDPTTRSIFNFRQSDPAVPETWGAINDGVMGGVSQSGISFEPDRAIFSGNVSTANSGGFASVRTRNFEPPLDLSNYRGLQLRVKGDGQRYKLFLRTETAWDGVAYAYSFDSSSYDWLNVEIPFSNLVPIFRAKTAIAPPVDLAHIRSIQIMLSKFEYDGQLNPHFHPGAFRLELEEIIAYGSQPANQLVWIGERPLPSLSNLPTIEIDPRSRDRATIAAIAVRSLSRL